MLPDPILPDPRPRLQTARVKGVAAAEVTVAVELAWSLSLTPPWERRERKSRGAGAWPPHAKSGPLFFVFGGLPNFGRAGSGRSGMGTTAIRKFIAANSFNSRPS